MQGLLYPQISQFSQNLLTLKHCWHRCEIWDEEEVILYKESSSKKYSLLIISNKLKAPNFLNITVILGILESLIM